MKENLSISSSTVTIFGLLFSLFSCMPRPALYSFELVYDMLKVLRNIKGLLISQGESMSGFLYSSRTGAQSLLPFHPTSFRNHHWVGTSRPSGSKQIALAKEQFSLGNKDTYYLDFILLAHC